MMFAYFRHSRFYFLIFPLSINWMRFNREWLSLFVLRADFPLSYCVTSKKKSSDPLWSWWRKYPFPYWIIELAVARQHMCSQCVSWNKKIDNNNNSNILQMAQTLIDCLTVLWNSSIAPIESIWLMISVICRNSWLKILPMEKSYFLAKELLWV